MLMDFIQEYIRYIKYERGHAATTILNEQNRLRFFHKWLCDNGYPMPAIDALTTPVLRRYLHWLVERKLRPRSIKGKMICIKNLCGYLVANSQLPNNPMNGLTLPKLDAAERKTITDAQISMLFDACEKQSSPRQIALSRAVLTVLAYAGLRRAEACDLLVNDFNATEKSLLVRHGKGDKSRRVFVPDAAVDNLREWLALRGTCEHEYLFCWGNRRLHHDGLASIMEHIKNVAGLAGNEAIKPHSIRHNFATRLMRNGADLRSIQSVLGHSSLQITSIYLHTDEQQLRDIADKSLLVTPMQATQEEPGHVKTGQRLRNSAWRAVRLHRL